MLTGIPAGESGCGPWLKVYFSLRDYPFPALVAEAMRAGGGSADDLAMLGAGSGQQRWTRSTDQASVWHRRFYDDFPRWRHRYDEFVATRIAPLFDEPVYYQAVPTFRVHLPGNVAVGEFHTDAQYHHPAGEVSFWLPLTRAWGSNSVWVAGPDGRLSAFVAAPGEVVVFDAVRQRHGNLVNTTGRTRVSFDFRCLPVRTFRETWLRSVNMGLRFVPGEYYNAEPVGHPPSS